MSFAERRQQVLDSLPDDIGALLVSTPGDGEGPNLRYLTGFNGSNGQILLARDPVFFTDGSALLWRADAIALVIALGAGMERIGGEAWLLHGRAPWPDYGSGLCARQ